MSDYMNELTHREKEVLKYIVEHFVKSALPVGSRAISKQTDLNLSSASIRNVMSDLEDRDLLSTPHTSSGRIPTEKGYRLYVDYLMSKRNLSENEINMIKTQFDDVKTVILTKMIFMSKLRRFLEKYPTSLPL
jgi:heat-inducible transcriptional repressor